MFLSVKVCSRLACDRLEPGGCGSETSADRTRIAWHYIEPGKPVQNVCVPKTLSGLFEQRIG
jgi:hypothetical protein